MKAKKTSRLIRETSILLVCDIQSKFVPRVYGREGALEASSMMVRAAKVFGIPIVVTEHTVKVMGETCEEIKKHLKEGQDFVIPKTKFSMIIPEVNEVLGKFK